MGWGPNRTFWVIVLWKKWEIGRNYKRDTWCLWFISVFKESGAEDYGWMNITKEKGENDLHTIHLHLCFLPVVVNSCCPVFLLSFLPTVHSQTVNWDDPFLPWVASVRGLAEGSGKLTHGWWLFLPRDSTIHKLWLTFRWSSQVSELSRYPGEICSILFWLNSSSEVLQIWDEVRRPQLPRSPERTTTSKPFCPSPVTVGYPECRT